MADRRSRFTYVLRIADASLILGQRLGEVVGHGPALEEDLGLANIALDLLGQARLLLNYAGEIEGLDRTDDVLAFLREEGEFCNPTLVEQPNVDFAHVLVRQLLVDAWQFVLYEALARSSDTRLAEIAAKSLKETRYHLGYSADWVVRLGDGTAESHERVQRAVDTLWPFTRELFDPDDVDIDMARIGVAPDLASLRESWHERVSEVLAEATLQRPVERPYRWYGKRGAHGEHLGRLLAEMQHLQRAYPGANW
jgi:ring-1,2-phenylacetyl-CoA epoxidase subunit PaaC